jgi:outer membrane protein
MTFNKIYITLLVSIFIGAKSFSQELLKKSVAVSLALEHNFDIKTVQNNIEIAGNNSSILNSGYLPTVSSNGAANYSIADSEFTLQTGEVQARSGVNTSRYNVSLGLNYTIFDGLGRSFNYKKLKENYNLSELQARLVIENSVLNIFTIYYEIARLTENVNTQKQTLNISRERWTRAKYSFEYAQNLKLDVLNAEVDYNNDSISFLTLVQQLDNEKRNLNLLLGREVGISFRVDTTLTYASNLEREELITRAKSNNVTVLQQQGAIRNAEYDLQVTRANSIPKIGLNASYSYAFNNLGVTSFFDQQSQWGPIVGASLTWNIFDGGLTKTQKQNAQVLLKNQMLSMEQIKLGIERDVSNAWTIYQTALFVLKAEEKNLETNLLNFNRTKEQHTLGQITSIEFRQAQLNLVNASLNYNKAKYSAKVAELALLQLSGGLMQAEF